MLTTNDLKNLIAKAKTGDVKLHPDTIVQICQELISFRVEREGILDALYSDLGEAGA